MLIVSRVHGIGVVVGSVKSAVEEGLRVIFVGDALVCSSYLRLANIGDFGYFLSVAEIVLIFHHAAGVSGSHRVVLFRVLGSFWLIAQAFYIQ